MSKALGKNPLLQEEPVLSEKDIETIKRARSNVEDFTTMSFKVRKTYLKKLRDYAYTNRIEIKEALDMALKEFLDKVPDDELLEYKEKPRRRKEAK